MTALAPFREVELPGITLQLDATYFPVLTATWVGTVTTEMMDVYFEVRAPYLRLAEALGRKTVVITDATRQNVPNAVVRKYIGDEAKRIDPTFPSLLGYAVVVPSRVLRGMVTAIQWVVGEMWVDLRQSPSLEGAYEVTRQMYRDAGLVPPPLPPEAPGGVG